MTWSIDKNIKLLGYAGLLPFVLLTLLIWLVQLDLLPFLALALSGYAAAIVSFLGGIHWGIGFSRIQSEGPAESASPAVRFHFVWGIAPSLLAWVALMMPASAALPLLALMVLVCYAVDRKTYPDAGLARWLRLRLQLTLVATASCVLAAAAL